MGGPFEGRVGPIRYQEPTSGSISDDTQLTLATCESIIQHGTVSPEHIAARFLSWFRRGRITGIGASTLKALRDLEMGAHWALAGARGERAAGNGAAMRAAPLAFLLDPAEAQDRQLLRDVCRITHHNEEAYVGALAVVLAIRSVAFSRLSSTADLLGEVARDLPDSLVRDRFVAIGGVAEDTPVAQVAQRFGSSGYVVESVPLAVYAARFIDREPLPDVLRAAIEAGGDTDTIASIAGQIAGAWVGARQIPRELVESLPAVEDITFIVDEFARTVASGR
jgi:ADP-ribosyl-[dinitrogen reductase] hydrolase